MNIKYIYHSGFYLEFDNINVVIDYYKGDLDGIDKSKKTFVMSTHSHRDHFNKDIFKLFKDYDEVVYVLSDDIELEGVNLYNASTDKNINFVSMNSKYEIDEIKIETFESTDLGIAILMDIEGKKIYHAGDLNWWTWHGYETEEEYKNMTDRFLNEMKKFEGREIDLAMLVLDPRQGERYYWGVEKFLSITKTKYFVPMHLWDKYETIDKFKQEHGNLLENTVLIETDKIKNEKFCVAL